MVIILLLSSYRLGLTYRFSKYAADWFDECGGVCNIYTVCRGRQHGVCGVCDIRRVD